MALLSAEEKGGLHSVVASDRSQGTWGPGRSTNFSGPRNWLGSDYEV